MSIMIGLGMLGLMLMASGFYASAPSAFGANISGAPYVFTTTFATAVAIITAIKLLGSSNAATDTAPVSRTGSAYRPSVSRGWLMMIVLGLLLITAALHTLYWLLIWDSTYDPIGVILLFLLGLIVLPAGAVVALSLHGRARALVPLIVVAMPLLFLAVMTTVQRSDFRQLTAGRAERVDRAIASFYAREGRYPTELSDLTLRDAVYLSGPLIIFGQTWCYEGEGDSYRLGYVDRQHWSDPRLFGHLHHEVGDRFDHQPLCASQIGALRATNPQYFALGDD